MPSVPTPSPALWQYGRIKPGKNSREVVVDDGIRELHQSILKNGLLQPLLVVDQEIDNLLAGFRRHVAIGLGGIELVSVLVYPASLNETQRRVINLTENLQRLGLTDQEVFLSCKELEALNPSWQRKDLAAHLNKDASTITRYLSPDDLMPQASKPSWRVSSDSRRPIASPKALTSSPRWRGFSTGTPATRWRRASRKQRAAATPAVRVPSIKVTLVNDISVVIKGEAIDLEQGIEALKDALKAMTKARDTGLDAKTARRSGKTWLRPVRPMSL